MKVLIVDDEFDPDSAATEARYGMRRRARDLGIDLVFALDSSEGIEAYRQENPDVVVTDMGMETYDAGLRVIEAIRETDMETPIYVNSNTDNDEVLARLSQMRKDEMYQGWVSKVLQEDDFEELLEKHGGDLK